ncbi:MAG: helix-turn-helix transcriptional regulator [Clostridia bacterium]|nr:helix-turn-helix transcriptional regulator [Clostridia bacterium]
MSKFSENLIRLRKEKGLTQQGLAYHLDITQQCISEWENDKIEPTMSNLVRIADCFEVSIDFLVGRKEY